MTTPLKYWTLRAKHGRNKTFETPEALWEAACKYFQWADENPWKRYDFLKSGDKAGQQVEITAPRPYTLTALYVYLNIDRTTWYLYRQDSNYEAYHEVVARIEDIIYVNKFEGAAVGVFNANIIARDLGLADRREAVGPVEINFSDAE